MKKFKKIYVAGPYTATDEIGTHKNVMSANAAGVELICNGWNPVIPHKNFAFMDNYIESRHELTNKLFYDLTLDLLATCDAIYLMENWIESTGAKNAYDYAIANGIPVFYYYNGFPAPTDLKNRRL